MRLFLLNSFLLLSPRNLSIVCNASTKNTFSVFDRLRFVLDLISNEGKSCKYSSVILLQQQPTAEMTAKRNPKDLFNVKSFYFIANEISIKVQPKNPVDQRCTKFIYGKSKLMFNK